MEIKNSISLDFGRFVNPPTVYAKQGDSKSRYITITPLANGNPWTIPDGTMAHFACRKPDGKHVYLDTPFIKNNIITVELSDQTLVVAGKSVCDIILISADGKIISSQNFNLEIEFSPGVYAELESTDEVQTLNKLIYIIETKLANGEFDGKDGAPGKDGPPGPVGPAGPAGTSVTHEWNGTVLTITSASGTSSADLQGPPGAPAEGGADLSSDTPLINGEASPGTSEEASRADHVHPTDTTRMLAADQMAVSVNLANTDHLIACGGEDNSMKRVMWGRMIALVKAAITSVKSATTAESLTDPVTGYKATLPELESDAVIAIAGDIATALADYYNKEQTEEYIKEYAQPSGDYLVPADLAAHSTSDTAHGDIRLLIEGIAKRLNAIADSDDITLDQLSEVVTYIKDNRELIEQITTGKVSVADIVNNLTTSATDKPLSAAQGVALKVLIDSIKVPTKVSAFTNDVGYLAKESLSLGIASDGLIYLFVNGEPVGTGIPQGQSGDVFGYVDENNTIWLNGNLADGTYSLKYEMDNGDIVAIGDMVLDSTVYYSVTSNLTACIISNTTKTVAEGESYSATITANDGYELSSVSVTMGGSAVSVTDGVISIASVTGDIVITAVAEEIVVAEPVTVDIALIDGIRIGSDGGDRTLAGYCATEMIDLRSIPKPCTIHLTKAQWHSDGTSSSVRYYVANTSGTALANGTTTSGSNNYFAVTSDDGDWGDSTVTVTSDDVGYVRFSGYWANKDYSDNSSSFASAGTKATLTYTPN